LTAPNLYPPQLAVGVTADRLARVTATARTVHRAVLTTFATSGHAPSRDDLAGVVEPSAVDAALRELHTADVLRLDTAGQVSAAYPSSGPPTPHRVQIAGGPAVYAICAIDALGIAAMLDRDITIQSAEPGTATPITVTVHDGQTEWVPETAVVFVGATGPATAEQCCPPDQRSTLTPAADRCCTVMNFFTTATAADGWTTAHPDVTGTVLNQAQARQLGADIFGPLLRSTPSEAPDE
jgi:Alkylmercury lyase